MSRHLSNGEPVHELKGFERVALAADETRTLEFRLGPEELRYWNTPARDWVQEPTVFDVWIGSDSTLPLKCALF
jgi:beta-glucosidase